MELESDKCLHNDFICNQIDSDSKCNKDKNQCLCKPNFYLFEKRCGKKIK